MPRHALLTPHSLGKQNTSEHRVPFSAKAVIFGKCDTMKTGQQKRWRKEEGGRRKEEEEEEEEENLSGISS